MTWYQFLVDTYASFLALFPAQIQWLVTLVLLLALVGAAIALVSRSPIFVILLLLLLPLFAPVAQQFFNDLYHFFLFMLQSLSTSAPKP